MSQFLDIEERAVRKPHSLTLLPSTLARIKEAADLHNTNQSRIVEALCTQYLPKIIEQATKQKETA